MVMLEKAGTIYEEIIREIGYLLQCVVSMLRDEDNQDGSEVLNFVKESFLFNLSYFFQCKTLLSRNRFSYILDFWMQITLPIL